MLAAQLPIASEASIAAMVGHIRLELRLLPWVAAYLLAAWLLSRLSLSVAVSAVAYWLVLPFAIRWAWPDDRTAPIWTRTILSGLVSAALAILLGALTG